jgi:hypothetical protein
MTALALLAQCWIAAAPLAEGRGLGAPAHVEGTGSGGKHFTHDAEDCAACAVMALQSLVPRVAAPPVPPIAEPEQVAGRVSTRPDFTPLRLSQPRAPPATR